jgi:chemotaxis protein MotB
MADEAAPDEDEGRSGAPGWIVTFADMMSLLLCFFVLLLAASSTDASKFRAIADSMRQTFSFNQNPVPGKGKPRTQQGPKIKIPSRPDKQSGADDGQDALDASAFYEAAMQIAKAEIDLFVGDQGLANYIETRVEGDKLRVVNSNPQNFPAGDVALLKSSFAYLDMLLVVLQKFDFDIIIEGHTDNRPINNSEYRSNWELSAGRAASFVLYLEANGIDPTRLAVHGYGPHRPVASNDFDDTRARNRRIEVLLKKPVDHMADAEADLADMS